MRYRVLLCLTLFAPLTAWAQDSINPYNIQQHCNIMLQATDVYYCPYAPPSPYDIRDSLSNQYTIVTDRNWCGQAYYYGMRTHDSLIADWKPCGSPLGHFANWQRLFYAQYKQDGSPSDIIAGDSVTDSIPHSAVTISKYEDVDFRATGKIRMGG